MGFLLASAYRRVAFISVVDIFTCVDGVEGPGIENKLDGSGLAPTPSSSMFSVTVLLIYIILQNVLFCT